MWDDKRELDFGSLKSKGCLPGIFFFFFWAVEDPASLSKGRHKEPACFPSGARGFAVYRAPSMARPLIVFFCFLVFGFFFECRPIRLIAHRNFSKTEVVRPSQLWVSVFS